MAIKLLADENLHSAILEGVIRVRGDAHFVAAQDLGLAGTGDPELLEWAAKEDYVVVTHDVNTMTHYAYERVKSGLSMPGLIVVPQVLGIGPAIDDLLLIIECSDVPDWVNQVRHLPL